MRRFNVRPIAAPSAPPPAPMISGKLPSAYSKSAASSGSTITHVMEAVAPAKKGRPSKDEARRHKMDMASEAIAALCSDKPTRNKVRKYFESRVLELDDEKR